MLLLTMSVQSRPDLSVVGYIHASDGLGTLPIELIKCLKNHLSLNFIPTRETRKHDVDKDVLDLVDASEDLDMTLAENTGKVAIFQDVLVHFKKTAYDLVPPQSIVKLAYSMFESTKIPPKWVEALNKNFDAVIVPDSWLVPVYESSGVKIPIFVVPVSLDLHRFLEKKPKNHPHKPLVFGNMSALEPRKNQKKLVEAFARAFGNSSKVRLLINVRYRNDRLHSEIADFIAFHNLENVTIQVGELTTETYRNFMANLDCYVSLSKGEGYSIPPRQSLALGIPVILSDNTAHTTLCKSGFVVGVESKILAKGQYMFHPKVLGNFFDCNIEEAAEAMKKMFEQYKHYYRKAQQGKKWVEQYLPENMKDAYLGLVKPRKVILGNKNEVKNGCLYTRSPELQQKYMQVIKN